MPATPDEQLQNLARLRANAGRVHCRHDETLADSAQTAASRMPLTHSTDETAFYGIIEAGALVSNDGRGRSSREVDRIIGSTNDVFVYLGAAAFPQKEMAFIFRASLTDHSRGHSIATPFDSGGCITRFPLPPGTNAAAFVSQHEMPVPECRNYLGDLVSSCFESVESYLSGHPYFTCPVCHKPLPDPHGLTPAALDDCGLDRLHEVRIAHRIELGLHLDAVLVPRGMASPVLAKLRKAGVKIASYSRAMPTSPRQTQALRVAATSFILQYYLS